MKIIVGSENPTKINAVQGVFNTAKITALDVPSNVSPQPFSDAETQRGAINRATHCMKSSPGAIGIGLEGGVMYIEERLFLCNWGALVTPTHKVFTASGARIQLPEEITVHLKAGRELGHLMDDYAVKREVSKKEGAIGIFTNNLITRKEMFKHVVKLLKGQLEYWQQIRSG